VIRSAALTDASGKIVVLGLPRSVDDRESIPASLDCLALLEIEAIQGRSRALWADPAGRAGPPSLRLSIKPARIFPRLGSSEV
jgi:hypothetical protein